MYTLISGFLASTSVDTTRVRFGCQVITYGDVERTVRYSKLVEEAGFDFITLPDHLFHPMDERFITEPAWDTHAMLGAIAVTTERAKMMPAVTDAIRRHPATTAHLIATVDQLSKGRAALGIGAGEQFAFRPLAEVDWSKPITRLREAIIVIRALWTSTREKPANFRGEYYELKDAYLGLKPLQKPNPPIYIGGYGPRIRALVAELGDGWIPWLETPETYQKAFSDIESYAAKLGRRVEDIDRAVMLFTSVSQDGEKAKARLFHRVAVSMAIRQRLLKNLGHEDLAKETVDAHLVMFTKEEVPKIYSIADRIPRESIESVIIAGTPDEAIDRIKEYTRADVKFLSLIPPMNGFEETIQLYRKKIIPYFRSQKA